MPNYIPSMSSDEVFIGQDTSVFLTPTLDSMNASIADKAASDHTHTGYAETNHTHTGFAVENHVHSGFASEGHDHDSDYAALSHTHDYAATDHTHSGFATANHSHTPSSIGAAVESHTHSGYAASNHTHSGYAASSHTHSEYFPVAGGTINGDTNVAGVIRANGQQAFYYATSTNSQTIGTANATGGTTIACGASANTTINGANVKMKNALPLASNTYTLGNTTVRWKGIYSNNAVNVASDRRLKRDIFEMDADELAAFVNKLNVVSYNYTDDAADAQARIGLVAQEVQEADADLAKFFVTEGEDGMLGMTPSNLVFALIAAVQKLSAEVAELKSAK